MPVLKAPPPQPKNETVQLRLSQDVKFRLARYAEFIHASPSYIVTETLERLFKKDLEFQEYLTAYKPLDSETNKEPEQAESSARTPAVNAKR
jgi:hypothetical protein